MSCLFHRVRVDNGSGEFTGSVLTSCIVSLAALCHQQSLAFFPEMIDGAFRYRHKGAGAGFPTRSDQRARRAQ
jgi:hypothetical protein